MTADTVHLSQWFNGLKGDRGTLNSELDEIAEYEFPERYGFLFNIVVEGMKRTNKLYSPIGPYLVSGLATNLEGICFPHEEQWFSLKADGIEGDVPQEVQTQLEQITDAVWDDFYNPASGGATSLGAALMDMVAFGPACLIVLDNPVGSPDFKVRSMDLRNTWIDTDADNEAYAMFCRQELSAMQIRQRYPGCPMPTPVAEILAEENPAASKKKFDIISAFYPRTVFNRQSDLSTEKQWAYTVFEESQKEIIEESGFDEKPFIFARWRKIVGEKYSWSPGRLALPDVKSFNLQMKALLESGALKARRPIATPSDSSFNMARIMPGQEVPYDIETAKLLGKIPFEALDVSGPLNEAIELLQILQKNLEAVFLKPLFDMPIEGPAMTATEVIARKQQFVTQLGPVYANILRLAQPLIERCSAIKVAAMRKRMDAAHQKEMKAKGWKGPLPKQTATRDLPTRLEFVSPVQKATNEIKAMKMMKGLTAIQGAIALDQSVADNVDLDMGARETLEFTEWPAAWIRKQAQGQSQAADQQTVEDIRQARAKAQQEAQATAQAAEAAKLAPGIEKAAPGTVPALLQGYGLGAPNPPPTPGGLPIQ